MLGLVLGLGPRLYEVRHMQLEQNTNTHVHYRPSHCTWHHVPSSGLPCPPEYTRGSANAECKPAEEPLREHQRHQSVQQASNCTSLTLIIWTWIVQTLQLGPMHFSWVPCTSAGSQTLQLGPMHFSWVPCMIFIVTKPKLFEPLFIQRFRASSDSQVWTVPRNGFVVYQQLEKG